MTTRIIHLAAVLALALTLPTAAADCDSRAWAFYGAVRNASGRPVGDAEVFLLLDEMNLAGYEKEGARGRRFRSNEFGKFQAGLICADNSDSPNPCAKKPKHLTVAVSSRDHAMKMQVFKLKDLEILYEDGVCLVHVPEIRLRREP